MTSFYQVFPNLIELQHFVFLYMTIKILIIHTWSSTSLAFGSWSRARSRALLKNLTSISVRRLDLQGYIIDHEWRCLDDEQSIQWETFWIKVNNLTSSLDLVNKIPNLHALNVRVLPSDDKHVDWLRQYLPLVCTIARDPYLVDKIRWNLIPMKKTVII